MDGREQQRKEIETIRERTITVNLSDADCHRLMLKCGESGLTVGKLVENFVGDLIDGTYSNGSDERDLVCQWFERCSFGLFQAQTLLSHLIWQGYAPESYLNALDNEECEELNDMMEDWSPQKEPDMGQEVAKIREWVKEKEALIDGCAKEVSDEQNL